MCSFHSCLTRYRHIGFSIFKVLLPDLMYYFELLRPNGQHITLSYAYSDRNGSVYSLCFVLIVYYKLNFINL